MATPDDLGAPLQDAGEANAREAPGAPRTLSVETPIAVIAANPRGRAVLEKDLPGLCSRPEYAMFKGMSLARLAGFSHGKITSAKLYRLQLDLMQVGATSEPVRSHNPLTEGERSLGRFSRSLYERVVMVIAAL